jgi:hypothetical protein
MLEPSRYAQGKLHEESQGGVGFVTCPLLLVTSSPCHSEPAEGSVSSFSSHPLPFVRACPVLDTGGEIENDLSPPSRSLS